MWGRLHKLNGFRYRILRNTASPLGSNRFPWHALGYLFKYLSHHNPSAYEGWLSVANVRVNHDIAAQELSLLSRHVLFILSTHSCTPTQDVSALGNEYEPTPGAAL
jgi:hypothetical protein